MKALLITAHPIKESFSEAISHTLTEALEAQTISVTRNHLIEKGFNPVLKREDFKGMQEGHLMKDVQDEQKLIKEHDLLVFNYPIWWFDRPAILKGWFDRVFTRGFAFDYDAQGPKGLLLNKKALVIQTTGGLKDMYLETGSNEVIQRTISDGSLRFCGIQLLSIKTWYGIPLLSDQERKNLLSEIKPWIQEFLPRSHHD